MDTTERIGIIAAAIVLIAILSSCTILAVREQDKVGAARVACINQGGIFQRDSTCAWSAVK